MLIRTGGARQWREPASGYASERDLEVLIQESPEVIPGVSAGPVAVVTQLGVPGVGPADIVVIDISGGITIIECKLEANPDIRRTVIGQVFAYAAGLAALTIDELEEAWMRRSSGRAISDSFRGPLPDEFDQTEHATKLAATMAEGRLRMVIAVDSMTAELKRTVSFINSHSGGTYELLGLELRYVKDDNVEILVPALYGEESAANKATRSSSRGPLPGAYYEFWQVFREWVETERPAWSTRAQPYRDNWSEFKSPMPGTAIWTIFKRNRRLAVEVATTAADTEQNRAVFDALFARREEIETAIGWEVQWEAREGKDWQRFRLVGPEASIMATEAHASYRAWFIEAMDRLWECLGPTTS